MKLASSFLIFLAASLSATAQTTTNFLGPYEPGHSTKLVTPASRDTAFPYGILMTMPAGMAGKTAAYIMTGTFPSMAQLSVTSGSQVLYSGLLNAPNLYYPVGPKTWATDLTGAGANPLPVGEEMKATMALPDGTVKTLTTQSFLRGVVEGPDGKTITLMGQFNVEAHPEVFLAWPFPVFPDEVKSVSPTAIVLDFNRSFMFLPSGPATYPITVRQGAVCDTIWLRYTPPSGQAQ